MVVCNVLVVYCVYGIGLVVQGGLGPWREVGSGEERGERERERRERE